MKTRGFDVTHTKNFDMIDGPVGVLPTRPTDHFTTRTFLGGGAMPQQSSTAIVAYKPIPGMPGYEASEDGFIWSRFDRATHAITDRRRKLKAWVARGYLRVGLKVDGRLRFFSVHRLVLLAFVGDPPLDHLGCHYDGDRMNNRLSNLRWDTQRSNEADKVRHGTRACGSRQGLARLTEESAAIIKRAILSGESRQSIAIRFGVNRTTVSRIGLGQTWRHVQ